MTTCPLFPPCPRSRTKTAPPSENFGTIISISSPATSPASRPTPSHRLSVSASAPLARPGMAGHHGSPGLRATPPSVSTWTAGNGAGSGRHSGTGTMPGGTRSSPPKKPAISSALRSWYGTAPVSA